MESEDFRFDQGRPLAPSGARGGLADRGVHAEKIVAADADTRNAVGGGTLGNPNPGDLQRLRHGDRPVVVLTKKDHRATVEGGEVQAFMEIALAGRPLAEADKTQPAVPVPFQG